MYLHIHIIMITQYVLYAQYELFDILLWLHMYHVFYSIFDPIKHGDELNFQFSDRSALTKHNQIQAVVIKYRE